MQWGLFLLPHYNKFQQGVIIMNIGSIVKNEGFLVGDPVTYCFRSVVNPTPKSVVHVYFGATINHREASATN